MFTFGREHEKKCAVGYVRNPEHAQLILAVIDAVHDLMEGYGSEEQLIEVLRTALSEGRSGVWEQAETWLRKASSDYPRVLELWPELASHSRAEVRFRVACVLNHLPTELATTLGSKLAIDKSKRVSQMAKTRMEETGGSY